MQTLKYEQQDHLATIAFNRPQMLNSLDETMAEELLTTIRSITKNPKIKVVVLNGHGPAFMAGGDVGFFYQNLKSLTNKAESIIAMVHEVVNLIQQSETIFIASVHGSVAGIGISFMLACDLVIASADTKFATAYTKIGLSPDGGSSYFLTHLLGRKKAFELLALSETFSAEEAKQLGLINWICPAESLAESTEKLTQKLLRGPSLAFAHVKRLVNRAEQTTLKEQLDDEGFGFVKSTETKDFVAGITAFVQKQMPTFEGK